MTLGTERMARKLADALRLAALHRDTFVSDKPLETSVELAAHRAESDLADLDLREDTETGGG